jgi:hypothetical protein
MPSYKQTLKQTYFPVQEAAAAWTAAKASAGAEFSAVEAERKALTEIRAARTRYAENLRPRENNDAFVMAALGGLVKAEGEKGKDKTPKGGFKYKNEAFDDAMVKARKAADKGGSPTKTDVENIVAAAKAAKTTDERNLVDALAKRAGGNASTKVEDVKRPTKSIAQVTAGNDAASREIRDSLEAGVAGAKGVLEQAQSSGSMGFEGGEGGKAWYNGLDAGQKRMLALYQSALEDDGVVSPGEIPGDVAEATKLFEEAKLQGGYRRKDRTLYDPSYLRMLQEETKAAAKLAEKEAKVQGKTVEGLSLELYRQMQGEEGQVDFMTGLPIQVASAVPPLLRSLQGDIASILQAHEASGSDTLAVPQTKAAQAAMKLKAGGMSAKTISAEMSKAGLPASDIRQALAFIAADDIVRSYSANVAPGTDPQVIGEIGATDAKAERKAELDAIAAAKSAALQAERAATRAAGQDTVRALDDVEAVRQAERKRLSESGLVRDRLKAKFGRTFQEAIPLPPTVPAAPTVPTVAPEPRLSDEEVERRIEASLAAEAAAATPPTPAAPRKKRYDPETDSYIEVP